MVQYGTIYGPEYGQPEIIHGPEYGQPEIIKTQKFNSYQIDVGQGNHLRTRCTKICCRGPYAVFLGRHSAREIHSIALDKTHDKNVASFGSQKNSLYRHQTNKDIWFSLIWLKQYSPAA